MSNLEECIASLLEVFKVMDVKYDQLQENLFSFATSGDNVKGVRYFIDFDEDGHSVNISGMDIASFGDKLAQGFVVANRLNHQYRWIKFIIHDDGNIITQNDAVIEPGTAGKEIMELIARNMHILDNVYPEIMKEIWG